MRALAVLAIVREAGTVADGRGPINVEGGMRRQHTIAASMSGAAALPMKV
jgi:hypothetical protein